MADVLVVDMVAVLDRSAVGKRATDELSSLWRQVATQPEAAQAPAREQLERRREGLRQELLARVGPEVAALAKARKAKLVLERSQVIWADASVEDVTAEVMAGVDRAGPLKA
jgi:Skp family chaperone for outer membrane proteins